MGAYNNSNHNSEKIYRQQFGDPRIKSRGVDTLKAVGGFAALGGALLWGVATVIEQVVTFTKQIRGRR